jgi:hypothetical protein
VPRSPHCRHVGPRRRWFLAAAAGTLYGAALLASLAALHTRRPHLLAAARAGGAQIPTTLGAALPDAMRPRRASAYLVARASDCSGSFEFLDLFDRPPVRDRLDLVGVIALGDEPAATTLRRALATRGYDLPVRPASHTLRATLATIGYHHTPYLIVLDADGVLRFAIGAPESVHQYLALGAALPTVADLDSARHEP